ncbi:MAG: 4-hydroxy-3-methylbut-2-enyl diphosphate reductase [Solirubrobacterales bacterium]
MSVALFTPLRLEARAVRGGAPGVRTVHTGMGPRRARRAAARLNGDHAAIGILGFAGGLSDDVAVGDLVVATEVRGPAGTTELRGAGLVAGMLRRRGLSVHTGPVVSRPRLVTGAERARLAADGAVAADMESAWLAPAAAGRPLVVVRALVDTPGRELRRPLATLGGWRAANRALREAAGVLAGWSKAIASRRVVLAAPRASCAGVERAIDVVERLLDQKGPPLYVRKQIVHNAHVVADLEGRGVVFVDEIDAVPEGANVVFSAHGVSPHVREEAVRRRLRTVDATCPLVSKVHAEARRFAGRGYTVVLVGHDGHDEVEGTRGEAPAAIRVVADAREAATVEVDNPDRVAYLTQTTLAVDEARDVIDVLRARFPRIVGPASDDICYATQNRQDAVRALAPECDVVLVVGSSNSSNSRRLVEVAERAGTTARLIDDESEVDPAWLVNHRTVGLTAGASAPERLVARVLDALAVLGPLEVSERSVTTETTRFKLPPEMRRGN